MGKTWPELFFIAEDLQRRLAHLETFVDIVGKSLKISELELQMTLPNFWDSQETSKKIIDEVKQLRRPLEPVAAMRERIDDLRTLLEILGENGAPDENSQDFLEVAAVAESLEKKMEDVELQAFLSGPHDPSNAIVSIHSGAGGTEACDWADMLLRMYLRWSELRNFKAEIEDMQPGEEAGISRVTFRVIGENAYGHMKAERGVHRLVRISPFDSNKRRHTSFCSVDVIAEIEDDVAIEIKDEDLRVDTYRSSGKGGQHVNKTDSAVRLTHLPSGIVVACQNERSQGKNRATAMKILRARLFEKTQDEKRSAMEKFYGEKGEIGWGNQIRSYVFQPYQMVKDLRTGVETGNVQAVMDGFIDDFINAWLRAGCPTSRS